METLLKQSRAFQSIIELQTEISTTRLEDLYCHLKWKLHAKISFSEKKTERNILASLSEKEPS